MQSTYPSIIAIYLLGTLVSFHLGRLFDPGAVFLLHIFGVRAAVHVALLKKRPRTGRRGFFSSSFVRASPYHEKTSFRFFASVFFSVVALVFVFLVAAKRSVMGTLSVCSYVPTAVICSFFLTPELQM